MKFQGTVHVEVTITAEGKIENIQIPKSPGYGLDEAIVQTVKTWKCKPAIGPSGKPTPVTAPFDIKFTWY